MAACSQKRAKGCAAGEGLGLGDLAFVVREDQVVAAAVDVDRVAEEAAGIVEHSMCQPGRPGPHGLGQAGSPGAWRLPQHEVERIALVRVVRDVAPLVGDREHLGAREMAQLPNSGQRRRAK